MRDERAAAAVERLREGAPEAELAQLRGLARAAAPVYACELEQTSDEGHLALSACVMNTSDDEVGPLDAVALLAPKTPPTNGGPELSERSLRRRLLIPPKTGVRVQGQVDDPEGSRAVEVVVEPSR